jgi:hypothetical protein
MISMKFAGRIEGFVIDDFEGEWELDGRSRSSSVLVSESLESSPAVLVEVLLRDVVGGSVCVVELDA